MYVCMHTCLTVCLSPLPPFVLCLVCLCLSFYLSPSLSRISPPPFQRSAAVFSHRKFAFLFKHCSCMRERGGQGTWESWCCLFLRIDSLSVCIYLSVCRCLCLLLSVCLSVHLSLARSLELPHPKSASSRTTRASVCRLTSAAATHVISPLQPSPFSARPPAPVHAHARTHAQTHTHTHTHGVRGQLQQPDTNHTGMPDVPALSRRP